MSAYDGGDGGDDDAVGAEREEAEERGEAAKAGAARVAGGHLQGGIHGEASRNLGLIHVWHGVTPSGRDPWLGWGTYIPCNPSVWEAELSH